MPLPRFDGAQHRGERHGALGQPCCDALLLPHRRPGLAGFVICDGAGGSPAIARSAVAGSRAAWAALLALRGDLRRHHGRAVPLHLLQSRFKARYLRARSGSCRGDHTLLACLWDRRQLLVVQVGDSTLLLQRQGQWECPLPPTKGEFANQTTFLRADTPTDAIQLWWAPASSIDAVIGFSDGLEAAFLAPRPGAASHLVPNAPLADLVVAEHRRRRAGRAYRAWLAASLADPSLVALSDDDRTLVIASR
jgi:hypothetical protein